MPFRRVGLTGGVHGAVFRSPEGVGRPALLFNALHSVYAGGTAKMPAGPFRRRSPNTEANMITLSDSVLDDLKTFRGRKADRTIRIEKGSSG